MFTKQQQVLRVGGGEGGVRKNNLLSALFVVIVALLSRSLTHTAAIANMRNINIKYKTSHFLCELLCGVWS